MSTIKFEVNEVYFEFRYGRRFPESLSENEVVQEVLNECREPNTTTVYDTEEMARNEFYGERLHCYTRKESGHGGVLLLVGRMYYLEKVWYDEDDNYEFGEILLTAAEPYGPQFDYVQTEQYPGNLMIHLSRPLDRDVQPYSFMIPCSGDDVDTDGTLEDALEFILEQHEEILDNCTEEVKDKIRDYLEVALDRYFDSED